MKKFIVSLICFLAIVESRSDNHDKKEAKSIDFIEVIWNSDIKTIKLLIEKGIDINQTNKYGYNTLHTIPACHNYIL
jgi:ankyrin repeat protein